MKKFIIVIALFAAPFMAKAQSIDSLTKSSIFLDSASDAKRWLSIPMTATNATYWSKPYKAYAVDWRKVKTFADLKRVLSALNLTYIGADTKQFMELKPYLKLK